MYYVMEKTIGERLRDLLHEQKMLGSDLANHLGVSKQYVSKLLNGEKTVSLPNIMAIAKAMPKADIRWLLTGEIIEGKELRFAENDIDFNGYNPMREKDRQIQDLHEMIKQLISKIPDAEPSPIV
jgi:transcriptional regulator with XRE-family HTH domain